LYEIANCDSLFSDKNTKSLMVRHNCSSYGKKGHQNSWVATLDILLGTTRPTGIAKIAGLENAKEIAKKPQTPGARYAAL